MRPRSAVRRTCGGSFCGSRTRRGGVGCAARSGRAVQSSVRRSADLRGLLLPVRAALAPRWRWGVAARSGRAVRPRSAVRRTCGGSFCGSRTRRGGVGCAARSGRAVPSRSAFRRTCGGSFCGSRTRRGGVGCAARSGRVVPPRSAFRRTCTGSYAAVRRTRREWRRVRAAQLSGRAVPPQVRFRRTCGGSFCGSRTRPRWRSVCGSTRGRRARGSPVPNGRRYARRW